MLLENINILIPQLTYDVELIILDNCSTDSTHAYCQINNANIHYLRHSSNIGPEQNLMACLKQAKGEYIWLLCDDDLPATNAIELILTFLRRGDRVGLLSLCAHWCGPKMEGYSKSSIVTQWDIINKNKFLEVIGDALTFCSAIIVRKDIIDINFVKSFTGTALVPAAIALQAAGNSNLIAMPREKILFGRSGNAGGYDAYTVFSKNLSVLLSKGKEFGFTSQALESVYKSALKGVMLYIISVWPKTIKGSFDLFFYSFLYKEFYSAQYFIMYFILDRNTMQQNCGIRIKL
jgi:glycosyltransferase involved in cell wall biosynthesis